MTAWNPNIIPDSKKSFEENVKNGKAALPPCHEVVVLTFSVATVTFRVQRTSACFRTPCQVTTACQPVLGSTGPVSGVKTMSGSRPASPPSRDPMARTRA